jgi:hypothetical protein
MKNMYKNKAVLSSIRQGNHNFNILPGQKDILSAGATVCFIISLASAFYINDERCPIFFLDVEYLKYLIYGILLSSLYLYSIYGYKRRIEIKGIAVFIFCLLLLIVLSYMRNYLDMVDFLKLLLLVPFILLGKEADLRKYLKKTYFVFLIENSIFLSLVGGIVDSGTKESGVRFIFNSNDPNFSAIYFLFGFMICSKLKYKWFKYLFILLGLSTGSRNFILAILVFYIIRYIKGIKVFSFVLKKIKPLYVFLFMEMLVIFIGIWFIFSVDISAGRNSAGLNDGSNKARFTYNTLGLVFLVSGGRKSFIDGAGAGYWETGAVHPLMNRGIHNSFLGYFVSNGIIAGSITLFFLFFVVHSCFHRKDNYEYIYAFLTATLFLGSLASNVFLFCWCYILAVKEN